MSKNSKVLILTYDFPPHGGVGVQRIVKFGKFLPQFGWTPIILTATEEDTSAKDPSLVDSTCVRFNVIRVKPLLSRQKLLKAKNDNELSYPWQRQTRPMSLKGKLLLFFRDWFLIPDSQVLWFITAIFPLIKAIRTEKPDTLLVTAPPFSCFFIALIAKLLTRIPIVLDYRDPWTQTFEGFRKSESPYRKKIETVLEKWIISASSLVVATTQQILEYCKRLDRDKIKKDKYILIYNGFDHEDFDYIQPEQFSKFTILYTGKIDAGLYNLMPFLQGFRLFLERNPGLREEIQVIFVGKFQQDEALTYIEQNMLSEVIELKGFQSHQTCIAMQKGADLLLVVANRGYHEQWVIASKIFEYVAAQKQILAIIPDDCPTADIINANKWGSVAEPSDVERIVDILETHISQSKNNAQKETADIEQFTRKSQTKLLADAMNRLL